MRRVAAVLTVVMVGALVGCSSGADPKPRPPAPSPSGLAAAVGDFATIGYRFEMTANEGRYSGAVDPAADALDATVHLTSGGATLKIDTLGGGGEYFARFAGLPRPGFDGATWFAVDPSRERRPGALGISAIGDPTGVRSLITVANDVRPTGERGYRGSVDLTRVAAWGPVSLARAGRLGAGARVVPFEAEVDERGRLIMMKVDVPSSGDVPSNIVTARYRDFGTPVTVSKPQAADPLPDHLYALLGL